tara:strand:- start:90 stop:317 length:228 start_codon:yes stop_codon:yes gene_type:complete
MAATSFPGVHTRDTATNPGPSRMRAENVDFFYGDTQALSQVCLEIPDRHVLALNYYRENLLSLITQTSLLDSLEI